MAMGWKSFGKWHCTYLSRFLIYHSNFTFLRPYSNQTRKVIHDALVSYEETNFVPFRINAFDLQKSFSRVNINLLQYLEDKNGNILERNQVSDKRLRSGNIITRSVPFQSMFADGFHSLKQYSKGKMVDDQLMYVISAFVYGFLSKIDYHGKCLRDIKCLEDESLITVILAIHLFSKMSGMTYTAPGKRYIVSKDLHRKPDKCPCSDNCEEEIIYGASGLGSEYLWYGNPEIILYPPGGGQVSISIPKVEKEDTINDSDRDLELIEVKIKSDHLRYSNNIQQFVSQCITCSLYQKVFQRRKPKLVSSRVTLIPSIAISAESFDIYMYDSENDILLRNMGNPIPLWSTTTGQDGIQRRSLNISSILKLWMVVNHMTIKPGLSPSVVTSLRGTCDFLNHLTTDYLAEVEDTITMKPTFDPLNEIEFPDVPDIPLRELL